MLTQENINDLPKYVKNPKKFRNYTESRQQQYFFDWLFYQHKKYWEICFCIPNEGQRTAAQAKSLAKRGLKAGIPDLFCAIPNERWHGLFIEMKTGKNKPSEIQKKMMNSLQKMGYKCVVCYSWHSAKKEFDEYVKNDLFVRLEHE